jgi:hypothetical protein
MTIAIFKFLSLHCISFACTQPSSDDDKIMESGQIESDAIDDADEDY